MSIEVYIISESHIYTPHEIQEGYHECDQNLGITIKVDENKLPPSLREDSELVAAEIGKWYYGVSTKRPDWIVD